MVYPIRNFRKRINNFGNNYANSYYANENDVTRTVNSPVNERHRYTQQKRDSELGKGLRFIGQLQNELRFPEVSSDSLSVQRKVDNYNKKIYEANNRMRTKYNTSQYEAKPSKVVRVEGIGGRTLYTPDENYSRPQGGNPPLTGPAGAWTKLPKVAQWILPWLKYGGEVRNYDIPQSRQYGAGGKIVGAAAKATLKAAAKKEEKTVVKGAAKAAAKRTTKAGVKAGAESAAKTASTSTGQLQRGVVTSVRRTKKPVELNLFESSAQTAKTTAKRTVKTGTKRVAKPATKRTTKAAPKPTPNLSAVQTPLSSGLRNMQNAITTPQYKLPSITELMEGSRVKPPFRLPKRKYVRPTTTVKSSTPTTVIVRDTEPGITQQLNSASREITRHVDKPSGFRGLYRSAKAAAFKSWRKGRDYLAKRKAERDAARAAQNPVEAAPQNATAAAEQVKPGFWARRKAARAAKREERLATDERRSRLETPFGFRQMWRGRPIYKDEKFIGRSKISGKNILMYGVPTGIGATMAIKGINRYIDKSPSYTPKSNIDQRNQTQQIRQIAEVPNSSQNTEYVPEDTVTNIAPQDTTAAVREEVVEQAPQREENSNNNVEQTNNSNNNVQQTNNSRTAPVNNNATVRNARAATRQNRRRNRMTNNYNAARRLKASLSFNPSSDQDLLYMNEADQRYQAAKNYLDSKDNPSDEDIKFATEVSPELKQEMDNEAAVRRQEATDEMINALDEERRRRGESFRFGGKIYKRR